MPSLFRPLNCFLSLIPVYLTVLIFGFILWFFSGTLLHRFKFATGESICLHRKELINISKTLWIMQTGVQCPTFQKRLSKELLPQPCWKHKICRHHWAKILLCFLLALSVNMRKQTASLKEYISSNTQCFPTFLRFFFISVTTCLSQVNWQTHPSSRTDKDPLPSMSPPAVSGLSVLDSGTRLLKHL